MSDYDTCRRFCVMDWGTSEPTRTLQPELSSARLFSVPLLFWPSRWPRPVSADHNAPKDVARKSGAPRIHLRCCSARTSAPWPGCEPYLRSAQTSNLSAETRPGPRAKRPPHPLPWIRTSFLRYACFEPGSSWTHPRPRSCYLATGPCPGCGSVRHRYCSHGGWNRPRVKPFQGMLRSLKVFPCRSLRPPGVISGRQHRTLAPLWMNFSLRGAFRLRASSPSAKLRRNRQHLRTKLRQNRSNRAPRLPKETPWWAWADTMGCTSPPPLFQPGWKLRWKNKSTPRKSRNASDPSASPFLVISSTSDALKTCHCRSRAPACHHLAKWSSRMCCGEVRQCAHKCSKHWCKRCIRGGAGGWFLDDRRGGLLTRTRVSTWLKRKQTVLLIKFFCGLLPFIPIWNTVRLFCDVFASVGIFFFFFFRFFWKGMRPREWNINGSAWGCHCLEMFLTAALEMLQGGFTFPLAQAEVIN